ncbi:MAG: bifunctional alpha,alpha-trehalose-phosphate synthase (UDP-forming)/trehalose-phosphatase [Bacteroidetes bacterium]|jgi:trehalose 6-phosphate synthase/phosphatase|nr:bifunctional alpha,alpha-trehalose-phosphate synthase (UDP-forming)/trehalose-phosphatase [Bacteroidota bacterium]
MSRLIIISNRLPVTIDKKHGELFYHPSAGGLATGLASLDASIERLWIGWPGVPIKNAKQKEDIKIDLEKDSLIPVFLSKKDIELYYEGFSNKVIWPHFHYFTQFTTYQDEYWEAYQQVNRAFAEVVIKNVRPNDYVWVHDYQLMLLPGMIREHFPNISIGFFLHIPFPSYEIFRMLPWRKEILKGVLGADQIGFHTFGYMRHFLSAAYRITGHEHQFGKITIENRLINVDVFPMGIDYNKYASTETNLFEEDKTFIIKQLANRQKLIISIDRLDYTKGIPQRIKAFEKFLIENPQYQSKVTFVMIVVPSRSNVDTYSELKNEVDTLVGAINSKYSTFNWSPINYMYRSLTWAELTTLYQVADIAMITPLRDGMNLVAKEYIASKEATKKGVLILSEMAGASNELTDALIVNPQDANDLVAAMIQALEMNEKEQAFRLEKMQKRLKIHTVKSWAENFMKEQMNLMEQQKNQAVKTLNSEDKKALLNAYRNAKNRLLVLDYDGTLMGFQNDPKAVSPDNEVIQILTLLKQDKKNCVIVNSGRDKPVLEEWLGYLDIDFAAGHGVYIKQNGKWSVNPGISNQWKNEIRLVLENVVERTPGTFIEEKEYSLAWHYRQIDKGLGEKRVREFRDVLNYLTANLDLQVLEGNKVIEIKSAGVNKGKALFNWLNGGRYDFIFAIGDDHTDEDIFKALTNEAFTVKVGLEKSDARFHVRKVEEVRQLLNEMTK